MKCECLLLAILITIVCIGNDSKLQAEDYTFLVAVQDYDPTQLTKLNYARNDIVEFRDALLKSGYKPENIVLMHDDYQSLPNATRYAPHAKSIRKELGLLLGGLEADDSIIVAFAGHGVQFKGEEVSYFCPLDVDLKDKERKSLISLTEVYAALKETQARKRLLLVDACRNDPVSAIARSAGKIDIESVSRPQTTPPPEGVVALFSCAAGQQAYEWPEFQHGIFFYQVLQAWNGGDKSLTLDQLIADAKSETTTFARLHVRALQTPRQMGFYEGEWILRKSNLPFEAKAGGNPLGPAMPLPGTSNAIVGSQAGEVRAFTDLDVKFCWCPSGSFKMGDDESQVNVTLSQGYWLGQTEVTQGLWQQVMQTTPWSGKIYVKEGVTYPATYVSWEDANEFCEKLTERERAAGRLPNDWSYRLPTEAEWEYACRAETTTAYSFGDNAQDLGQYAWFAENADDVGEEYAHTVGTKRPNTWNLHDLHGNVWEWCQDIYAEKLPGGRDPLVTSGDSFRVLRGGGWRVSAWYCRSAYRLWFDPSIRFNYLGFRLALSPSDR